MLRPRIRKKVFSARIDFLEKESCPRALHACTPGPKAAVLDALRSPSQARQATARDAHRATLPTPRVRAAAGQGEDGAARARTCRRARRRSCHGAERPPPSRPRAQTLTCGARAPLGSSRLGDSSRRARRSRPLPASGRATRKWSPHRNEGRAPPPALASRPSLPPKTKRARAQVVASSAALGLLRPLASAPAPFPLVPRLLLLACVWRCWRKQTPRRSR